MLAPIALTIPPMTPMRAMTVIVGVGERGGCVHTLLGLERGLRNRSTLSASLGYV